MSGQSDDFRKGVEAERQRQRLLAKTERELRESGVPAKVAPGWARMLSALGLKDDGYGPYVTDERGEYRQSVRAWVDSDEARELRKSQAFVEATSGTNASSSSAAGPVARETAAEQVRTFLVPTSREPLPTTREGIADALYRALRGES